MSVTLLLLELMFLSGGCVVHGMDAGGRVPGAGFNAGHD